MKSSPKEKRPLDTKSAMHLTLKASDGILRLPKTMIAVNREVEKMCRKYHFPLYKYSNNFNHLHLLIRVTNRFRWQSFIRELTGRLAQIVQQLTHKKMKLWLGRPFTRIVKGWGRNYRKVKEYIELNILEASHKLTRENGRELQRLRREFAA